jgi:hypothetical protein
MARQKKRRRYASPIEEHIETAKRTVRNQASINEELEDAIKKKECQRVVRTIRRGGVERGIAVAHLNSARTRMRDATLESTQQESEKQTDRLRDLEERAFKVCQIKS